MRAWTYHVPVPAEQAKIAYCDVKIDHGAFDYDALLSHWEKASRKFGAEPTIYRGDFMTDPASPMYERVKVMWEFVYSDWFDRPTAFLDSDAFPNADINHVFDGDWDIGVTYRHNMGMALNEGVIFANNRNPNRVRAFFSAYLNAYNRLIEDAAIQAKYGNIKRWRGGQLSLNAIANPLGMPTSLDRIECHGATVAYFPCFRWNFPCERIDPAELDTKAIIHLKGARKHLLDDLVRYQNAR